MRELEVGIGRRFAMRHLVGGHRDLEAIGQAH